MAVAVVIQLQLDGQINGYVGGWIITLIFKGKDLIARKQSCCGDLGHVMKIE